MGRDKKNFPAGEVRCIARAMAKGNLSQRQAGQILHVTDTTMNRWLDRIKELYGLDLRTYDGVTQGLRFGKALTRGDRIRAMPDEQLALKILSEGGDGVAVGYCRNNGKCKGIDLENEEIPDARCVECIKKWLKEVPE